jgi:hypothetical protein
MPIEQAKADQYESSYLLDFFNSHILSLSSSIMYINLFILQFHQIFHTSQ